MPSFTRFVHVVRCYLTNVDGSPNISSGVFVDVMVTDKFAFQGVDGQGFKVDVTAANAVPTINDYTGDYGSIDHGNSATRQTHILRVTSTMDSTQYLDVEVLDQFCVTGVNGQQWKGNFSSADATVYFIAVNGPDLSGSFTSPEETVTTNLSNATRLAELNEIAQLSIPYSYPLAVSPPPTSSIDPTQSSNANYIAVEKFQEISFTGVNGQSWKFDLRDQQQQINDTTNYVTDNNGNLIPPPNTDPDPYIFIPSSSNGPWTNNSVVSQGPIWQIINASGGISVLVQITFNLNSLSTVTPVGDSSLVALSPYTVIDAESYNEYVSANGPEQYTWMVDIQSGTLVGDPPRYDYIFTPASGASFGDAIATCLATNNTFNPWGAPWSFFQLVSGPVDDGPLVSASVGFSALWLIKIPTPTLPITSPINIALLTLGDNANEFGSMNWGLTAYWFVGSQPGPPPLQGGGDVISTYPTNITLPSLMFSQNPTAEIGFLGDPDTQYWLQLTGLSADLKTPTWAFVPV